MALLAHTDKTTVNPLDLDQWRFYVVSTRQLDRAVGAGHSIGLAALDRLCDPIGFPQLPSPVAAAAPEPPPNGPGSPRPG